MMMRKRAYKSGMVERTFNGGGGVEDVDGNAGGRRGTGNLGDARVPPLGQNVGGGPVPEVFFGMDVKGVGAIGADEMVAKLGRQFGQMSSSGGLNCDASVAESGG